MPSDLSILADLMAVLEDRKQTSPAGSYTVRLFNGGLERIGAKVMEEAAEVVEAAGLPDDAAVVHEAADVLYHLFVLLVWRGVSLEEVAQELRRRFRATR